MFHISVETERKHATEDYLRIVDAEQRQTVLEAAVFVGPGDQQQQLGELLLLQIYYLKLQIK